MSPLPPGILSAKRFVPHTLEHLAEMRVFPNPIPELAYAKMVAEYEALEGVEVWDITYESDGLVITGIMALPTQMQDAHKVLVYNRGGSRDYGKLTILNVLRSMVPFAKQGYLVFASNYRGNAGSEGVEEFGGSDVRDVLRLLDIARVHPAFDGENAFMMGHSRGGMMTAMAIRAGADVRAAISIAGIADARKLVTYPHLLERVLAPLVPNFATQAEAELARRSAVLWPEEIRVPLLLLHGDNDADVHVSDSEELKTALEGAGGTSRLVVYPGGNHALLRHWQGVLAESTAWLEEHSL
ncbi:MAG: prolyl oligopeptidase family serine peptidase [Rickettsiales bacterium]|nr:prolyl oligopeptidase family serine peptidase [Rickettsiales bacterium]